MLINWFTVIAQAINFLILVWLLKRFLYKPILRAIDEREKGITSQLEAAEAKAADAEAQREDLAHKKQAFDQERAALFQKAVGEAKSERDRLLDLARAEADSLRAKRDLALRNEERNLEQEIIRWTQQEVFAITRKTLVDLAATSLEERMTAVFLERVRALDGAAKEQLAATLNTGSQPVRLRSAFELPAAQRNTIESAVKEAFGAETHVQFETAPELVSGIELSANGYKIAWNIADYLNALKGSAAQLVNKDANGQLA